MNEVSLWYHPFLEALGYAIFHSLWQGVLLFFPLQIILFFCKKAHIRYRLLYGSFMLLFILFITTFLVEWNTAIHIQQQSISLVAFINNNKTANSDFNAIINAPHHWWQRLEHLYHTPAFRKILPAISICYVLGILLLGLRMIISFGNLRTIRKQVLPVSIAFQERFSSLLRLIAIKKNVSLYFSEHVNVPLMMGHLKPIVILPVALINKLDWQQTEAILIHELAHVKRMDYLFNILQSVMEVFLFFNPIVWWFSGIIRKEREHCCDDITVQHTAQPVKYAEALFQLELSKKSPLPAMAAAGNNKKHSLLNRIKRIVEMKNTSKRSPQSIFATLTFLMFFAILFCYYTTVAQEPKKDEHTKQMEQTSSSTSTVTSNDVNTAETQSNEEPPAPPDPQEPPAPPNINDIVSDAMNVANVAMANINWDDINNAMSQAGDELSKIDFDDIQKSFDDAQKDIDDAQKEIDNVDWADINKSIADAQQAIKEINWDDIGNDINAGFQSAQGMDKATKAKIMKDVRKAMDEARIECKKAGLNSRVIMDSLRTIRVQTMNNLKTLRNTQLQQLSVVRDSTLRIASNARAIALRNAADARRSADDARRTAADARRTAIDAKKQAFSNGKTTGLLNKLEQNGLIDRSKNFAVSYKNNVLMVNGKSVPVADYQDYLPKGSNASLNISGSKNNLAISQNE
ncbi:M48 family metalloprotease [Taibaiella lutea]|uniref:M48 family metalloprotease n=1 Tax=Taibaiella lutea TaxID=2608001 RepID=A0A5M6CMX6_9BACT|nr:M56 family metallopeptidase [Taibaiella lutea]KAA5536403.1 M48 family metalloprotease [Taibaiella lutea]